MPSPSFSSPADIGALYGEHHSWLLGWLRRRLAGADDAADLAHDTFLRLLGVQAQGRPLPLREPRAYLTTVARNLLINHVRRQALEQAWLDAVAHLPQAMAPSPEQRLLVLETLREVDRMLDGLPSKAREAFLLAQLDGLTYREVALQLGVTERTIKRYMAEAFTQCILLAVP